MSILLSGSLAYDYIMDFPDSFKNHILPEQIHILNVCFVVEKLQKNFGGTAGNIAYTMKLLGGSPVVLSPVGSDAGDYLEHFKRLGINTTHMPTSKEFLTASAHITTDRDDNQITAFYNGALADAVKLSPKNVTETISLALISPTSKDAMILHAKECAEKKIRLVFDPGQQITALSPQELMLLIGQASFLIANDYELKLIESKTGWNTLELLNHVKVLIITLGDRGSIILTKNERHEIAPCQPASTDDPTGAGDAYRAGFFVALEKELDLKTCGQVGSVAAAYAIEHYGTQNHHFTMNEFKKRYEQTFGSELSL